MLFEFIYPSLNNCMMASSYIHNGIEQGDERGGHVPCPDTIGE